MSKLIPFLFFFLAACTNKINPETNTVGDVRRFDPVSVGFEETERIAAICRALASKEELLSILVSTATEYNFSYTQKGCSESSLPLPRIISTTIQTTTDSNFVFKTKDNSAFGFTDVETVTKGVMSKICENLGNLTSPLQTSLTGATWFTTNTAPESCVSDENGFCIHIQRGSVSEGVNYLIHTNEWIKFKMENANRGFFTERTLISSAGCSENKTLEKKSILR